MKKILSLTLALALSLTLCAPVLAAEGKSFTDVPAGAWYHTPVVTAAGLSLIDGYSDGRFGPEDKVTYAQYATMLANICWKDEVRSYEDIAAGQPWYMPYILTCESHGVFDGTVFGDCPNWDEAKQPITREAMAQMSYNFLSVAGVDMSMSRAEELLGVARIKDYNSIDAGNQEAVVWSYVNGVLNGYSNGNFGPKDSLTRAQAATVLCQVYGRATGDVTGSGTTTEKPEKPVEPEKPEPAGRPADAIGGQYNTSIFNVPADANKDGYITESEVQAVLDALKVEFPPKTLWNDPAIWGTDPNSPNGYITAASGKDQIHRYVSKTMGGATGCAAWAYLVSDRIFGNLPRRAIPNVADMHIGDIFYSHNPHWMVLTGDAGNGYPTITGTGSNSIDTIQWTEGNETFDELQALVDEGWMNLYTRYPQE